MKATVQVQVSFDDNETWTVEYQGTQYRVHYVLYSENTAMLYGLRQYKNGGENKNGTRLFNVPLRGLPLSVKDAIVEAVETMAGWQEPSV